MRWLHRLSTLIVLALAGVPAAGFPGLPGSDPWTFRPNDPDYPGMWQLFSHLPVDHRGVVIPAERELGAGMRVDRAWQLHTGTPGALIAVLDSGINWESRDLIERAWLNVGELPLPHGATSYDANGDGRVSVADYAADPRVHDANGNGVLDAGDLILVFSDGIDQDGNGYVDDISGWDFHEQDNDPADRTRFGHGTGEARDSAAALNNGIAGAGVCGDCSFVPLRVDDSFVVDAHAFAAAVRYATRIGAVVIQEALGSINSSPYVQEALDEAYARDVVVIGSAADEDSYHHNYPATLDPVVYVNAIRHDTADFRDATTFLNFNNCSNYGARVDVAASGRFCSSEATGNLAGIAALAASYAKSKGTPLKAGELISLIKTTATDLAYAGSASRHATHPGWDMYSGYGRVDAHAMLERIAGGKIPPEARLVTPGWFERFDPTLQSRITVKAQVATPRSGVMRVRLEAAKGVETTRTPFVTLAETAVLTSAIDGVIAEVPLTALAALRDGGLDPEPYHRAYTLRLVVDDLAGQVGEARRTIFVERDPTLVEGWPRRMPGSGESAGFFADLNGDGKEELITADGAGLVHAYAHGVPGELPGFPARGVRSIHAPQEATDGEAPLASIFAPLAGADLDGDGSFEIVAATLEGHLVVLGPDGRTREGFPVALPTLPRDAATPQQVVAKGVLAAPVLVDLDNDGALDIVVAALDGRIHAYDHRGAALPGFPVEVRAGGRLAKIVSSPAVADVDRDGVPDLIFGTNHTSTESGWIFAVSGRGSLAPSALLAGFPTRLPLIRADVLPTVGTGVPAAPAVADLDGDGAPEILVHAFIGKLYAFGLDGAIKGSFSLNPSATAETGEDQMIPAFSSPVVGDLTGDGRLSPVAIGAGRRMLVSMLLGGRRYAYDHMVAAWDARTGEMWPGYPKRLDDMGLAGSPLVLDLDDDGKGEVVAASGGYFVRAWSAAGAQAGFPKFTGGWVFATPTAGDFDGDGKLELAATTREGYVHIWRTQARAKQGQWVTFKANPRRTGGH